MNTILILILGERAVDLLMLRESRFEALKDCCVQLCSIKAISVYEKKKVFVLPSFSM
jgi:hypothetical protein